MESPSPSSLLWSVSCLFLWSLVDDAPGFAERAFQRVRRHRLDAGGDADGVLDMGGDPFGVLAEPAAVPALRARLRQHHHLVHSPLARQFDNEMTAAPIAAKQRFLDLGREHVDAA